MKTYTTIQAGRLMFACPVDERLDLLGVVRLTNLNESEQVNLTEDELAEFETMTGYIIESDSVHQDVLWALQTWLEEEGLLEERRLPTIEAVLNDSCVSYWLKDALKSALDRDSLDALRDAELLHQLLKAKNP